MAMQAKFQSAIHRHSPEIATLFAALRSTGTLPRRGRALELGCGSGAESWFLAKRGWQVLAVDSDKEEVEELRSTARAHRLTRLRAEQSSALGPSLLQKFIPRAEIGTYDLVVERLLLTNVSAGGPITGLRGQSVSALRRNLIRAAARALRPGGVFVLRFNVVLDDAGVPREDRRKRMPVLTPGDLSEARQYFRFDERLAVSYIGYSAPWARGFSDLDGTEIATSPLRLAILVMVRTETPFGLSRRRK